MTTPTPNPREHRGRIVLVVGIDLSDVSEQLLANARDFLRSAEAAELHLVHAVHPESLRSTLTVPISEKGGPESQAHVEAAEWQLERLGASIVGDSGAQVRIHTPVGYPAEEITRIAKEVGADLILVEAHDRPWPKRMFYPSVVARIARSAPCSVLASRPRAHAHEAAKRSA
jgi:nucleotide-binding universal stress UspA family protein